MGLKVRDAIRLLEGEGAGFRLQREAVTGNTSIQFGQDA